MDLVIENKGVPRFSFGNPAKLVALIVTEPQTETIMWSVHPAAFKASPAPDGRFAAVPIPDIAIKAVDLIRKPVVDDDRTLDEIRAIGHVTYGVVPDDYVERVQARELKRGGEYRVSATAVDFEHVSKLFCLVDAT